MTIYLSPDSEKKRPKEYIELIRLNNKIYYASFSNNHENLEGEIFDITHQAIS